MSHSVPDPYHDLGPGRLEGVVLLLAIPLSAQGVPGPALSVLPEGIAPRDGTRGRARGPVLLRLAGGSAPSPPHLPANASLALVARSVTVVVLLLAGGGTRQMTVPSHVVEALATGQVGVVGAPPRDAESRAYLDLLLRKVGGARGARAIAAVALAVNLLVMESAGTPIAVV